MREQDKLIETVQKAIVTNSVNGLDIYFTYETFDEIAHIEIVETKTSIVLDSYTDDHISVEIISKDYPQFFSTNK